MEKSKVTPYKFLPLLRSPPYLRDREMIVKLLLHFPPVFVKLRRAHHGNTGGDLRWLAPLPLDSFRQNVYINISIDLYAQSFTEQVYGMLTIKCTVLIG